MANQNKQWKLGNKSYLISDEMIGAYKADSTTLVKLIDPPRLSEAETLRFIRSNTSIPVPEVYEAFIDESINRAVIVMEYIEGNIPRDVWDEMDKTQQEDIISQLRAYMTDLRSIKGDFIGSVDRGSCEDPVFGGLIGGFGPHASEDELRGGLVRALKMGSENPWVDQVSRFVEALPRHEIVLTHADFSPKNILVKEGRVVGIVDWRMAGFYPEYWEYVTAMREPDWGSGWFDNGVVDKVLSPYYLEQSVVMHVQKTLWG